MARIVGAATYFVAFPLLYALSVVAGRATRLAGSEVSLVWPAAAVGVIWMLATSTRGTRERITHVVLLGLVAYSTNVATGATPILSAWFVLVNIVLSLVTVAVLRYRRNEVVLRDPADLARLAAAVAVGTCSGAVLATGYFAVAKGADMFETFALFAVRNGVTALLGVAIWLRLRDVSWKRPRTSVGAVLEALLAIAANGVRSSWLASDTNWRTRVSLWWRAVSAPAIRSSIRFSAEPS